MSSQSVLDTSQRLATALSYATKEVPSGSPDDSVATLRQRLVERPFVSAADVAVCVGDRLVGLITLEALLAAEGHLLLSDLMDTDPPTVAQDLDPEKAAWVMVQHGESSLAVLDPVGRFVGLVPPVRMLSVLLSEHNEDMSRLAGVMARGTSARTASVESVHRRLWHRLPWLAVGLAGAMLSAWLVGSAEDQLIQTVQLAFFLPAIVYLADAVGTQTETLAIRGLSVGVPIRAVLGKELLTGVIIGLLISVACYGFAQALFDSQSVALTVALALFASCTVASVVALLLPWSLAAAGRDPAYGSGPLATVIQDLLSIAIYLLLALVLIT